MKFLHVIKPMSRGDFLSSSGKISPSALFNFLIFIACVLFVTYVSFFVNSAGRSLWFDEVQMSYILGKKNLWGVLTIDFIEAIGRPQGFLILTKLATYIQDTEITYRLINSLPFAVSIWALLKLLAKPKYFFALSFFALTVLLSDNYIRLLATYKSYIWDVAAALLTIVLLRDWLESKTIENYQKPLLGMTFLALFSNVVWPAYTIIFGLACSRFIKTNIKEFSLKNLESAISRKDVLFFAIMTLIWLYILQYVGRGFLRSSAGYVYGFVSSTNALSFSAAGALQILNTFLGLAKNFGVLEASSDMPFFVLREYKYTVAYVILGAALISLIFKNKIVYFCYAYFAFVIILKLLVSWPFDAERWSIGLMVFILLPACVTFSKIENKAPWLALILILGTFGLQTPFKSHSYHGISFLTPKYWNNRANPHTSTREAVAYLNYYSTKEDVTIIQTNNTSKMTGYYLSSYKKGKAFPHAASMPSFNINALQPVLPQLGGLEITGKVAWINLHSFFYYEKVMEPIRSHCNIIEENKNLSEVNGTKLLRASVVIFDCTKNQPKPSAPNP